MFEHLRNSKIIISDFDGTLSPFVTHPEQARVDPVLQKIISQIPALGIDLWIASGRPVDFLKRLIALADLPMESTLMGSYGLELFSAAQGNLLHPLAIECKEDRDKIKDSLNEMELAGLRVEIKPFSVVLHWRDAPENEAKGLAIASEISQTYDFSMRTGKANVELCSKKMVDKSTVIFWLKTIYDTALFEPFTGENSNSKILAMGDDYGDIPLFKALRRKTIEPFLVAVDTGDTPLALRDLADLTVFSHDELASFLVKVIDSETD